MHAPLPSAAPPTPVAPSVATPSFKPRWVLAEPQKPGASLRAAPASPLVDVVALADGSRGLLHQGARLRFAHGSGSVSPIGNDPDELQKVTVLADAYGGGCLFEGKRGVYFGKTFDGALRKIAPLAEGDMVTLGHGYVMVSKGEVSPAMLAKVESGKLKADDLLRDIKSYDLATGAPRKSSLAIPVLHPDGFSLLVDVDLAALKPTAHRQSWLGAIRFTSDGKRFTPLAVKDVDLWYLDGDSIVLMTKTGGQRVRKSGKLESIANAGPELGLWQRAKAIVAQVAMPVAADLPAALVTDGWSTVPNRASGGAGAGAFALYRHGKLFSYDLSSGRLASQDLAGLASPDECQLMEQGADRLLLCAEISTEGMSYEVFALDVTTGRLVSEKKERIVLAESTGSVNVGPASGIEDGAFLVTSRTCEGAASREHVCERRPGGVWKTRKLSGEPAQIYLFQGRAYALAQRPPRPAAAQELVVRDLDTDAETVFAADTVAAFRSAIGASRPPTAAANVQINADPIVLGAASPRPGLLRLTYSAAPFAPSGGSRSFADFDLATRRIAVTPISASSAFAGQRALGVQGGKLVESHDGGATWTEVEPPPTGVPSEIDTCARLGCVASPWIRVGWSG